MLKRVAGAIVLILSFAVMPATGFSKPEIEAGFSENRIHSDETAMFFVRMAWPKQEANYTFDVPELVFRNMALQHRGESQESFVADGADWVRKTISFTVKPLGVGRGEVYPFDLSYVDPATQKGGNFHIGFQTITVTGAALKISPLPLVLIGGGIILTIAAGFIFFLASRKRKAAELQVPEETREEKILKQIHATISSRSSKTRKEIIHELGLILKNFTAECYQIPATMLEDAACLEQLKAKGIDRGEIAALKRIHNRFSEAKYTGTELSERDLDDMCRDMVRFVEGKRIL